MYLKYSLVAGFVIGAALLFSACNKNSKDGEPKSIDKAKVDELYAIGAGIKVKIFTDDSLIAGYNNVYIELYDSLNASSKIENAEIVLSPEMTMLMNGMTKKHGCPVENPVYIASDKIYKGALQFTMPSSEGNTWALQLKVTNKNNGKSGIANCNIQVKNPALSRVKSVTTTNGKKLSIALVQPAKPIVGVNDIELSIFSQIDGYTYEPATIYQVVEDIEMPSMGHGSPNNVNPQLVTAGHYKGKVNYTMTGDWRINLSLLENGSTVCTGLYFDQLVP